MCSVGEGFEAEYVETFKKHLSPLKVKAVFILYTIWQPQSTIRKRYRARLFRYLQPVEGKVTTESAADFLRYTNKVSHA